MESLESVSRSLIPLEEPFFIECIEMKHSLSVDYWRGRNGSDERTYLADNVSEAKMAAVKLLKGERLHGSDGYDQRQVFAGLHN